MKQTLKRLMPYINEYKDLDQMEKLFTQLPLRDLDKIESKRKLIGGTLISFVSVFDEISLSFY